jgi:hypothetical protein
MRLEPRCQPARSFAQQRGGFINRFIWKAGIGAYALCRKCRRGAGRFLRRHRFEL